ncbi:MAG: ribosome maturation factor RimM [bacterium]
MNREDLITVGVITAPHGVRGEVKVMLLTDFPQRVYRLKSVYLISAQAVTGSYGVRGARLAGDQAIIALEGIDSPEEASRLTGCELAVTLDQAVTLPEGHYFYFQLVGLEVYSLEGERLGVLTEILPLPANDVYVVRSEAGAEILLPATREVVRAIDLEAGCMTVFLLPGLC